MYTSVCEQSCFTSITVATYRTGILEAYVQSLPTCMLLVTETPSLSIIFRVCAGHSWIAGIALGTHQALCILLDSWHSSWYTSGTCILLDSWHSSWYTSGTCILLDSWHSSWYTSGTCIVLDSWHSSWYTSGTCRQGSIQNFVLTDKPLL